jgi:hypothetical protein
MEEDRAQADLGIAADIEEAHTPPPPEPSTKQPKKRFVGRRTAAARNAGSEQTSESSRAIQGMNKLTVKSRLCSVVRWTNNCTSLTNKAAT